MMMQITKPATLPLLLSLLLLGAARAHAQATKPLYDTPPPYPGFQVPHIAGTLRYSLSASESISTGYNGANSGNFYATSFSGNMGYISPSAVNPFSLIYSGGYVITTGGSQSQSFQNLAASQVFHLKRWEFLVSDAVSYLPRSADPGLSGVAGVGDLGSTPIDTGGFLGESLLSNQGTRVTNLVSASASHPISGRTSFNMSGSYQILRFPGNNTGIPYNSTDGSAGVSHVLSPRTTYGFNYFVSRSSYLGYDVSFLTQGASVFVTHALSAKLNTSLSAGPVYTTTTNTPGALNYNANASISYLLGLNSFTAQYVRAVRTGSGITTATRADTAGISLSRKLGRFSNVSLSADYDRSTTLASPLSPQFTIAGELAGIQASRSISRTLSAYISYTARHQETPVNAFTVNALQGLSQTVGFGVTYSPRAITFGR